MDIFKLDPTTYLPMSGLVKGWNNMVWVERYLPAGEFELRTHRVEEHMNLLSEGSLIGIRESREVMQVEDHNVDVDDDGLDELVITGRTFEAPLLEGRLLGMGNYKEPFRTQKNNTGDPAQGAPGVGYTSVEAAAVVAWEVLLNSSNWSVLEPGYGNNPNNVIPNLIMSITEYTNEVNQYWWLENGPAYPVILDFLTKARAGVRNVRPAYTLPSPSVYFSVNDAGTIVTYPGADFKTRLLMDFYRGLNRSEGQNAVPAVVFDWRKGQLARPRYLFSSKNLKNIAVVKSKIGSVDVYANPDVDPYLTGRNRKYLYIDGGDPGDIAQETFIQGLIQMGEIELAKYNRIAAMESSITAKTTSKYGQHYFLGDMVTLRAQYGLNQTMQVTEYMRASNGTVDTGVPTLTLPA